MSNDGKDVLIVWLVMAVLAIGGFAVWQYNKIKYLESKGIFGTGTSMLLKTTCVDVTSYDYNWDNDVKCTRPDGSVFYTDYSGADQYGYDFP